VLSLATGSRRRRSAMYLDPLRQVLDFAEAETNPPASPATIRSSRSTCPVA